MPPLIFNIELEALVRTIRQEKEIIKRIQKISQIITICIKYDIIHRRSKNSSKKFLKVMNNFSKTAG